MNSDPEWPPYKTEAELDAIGFQVLRCLEGLTLSQAHVVVEKLVPSLLGTAYAVDTESINRLEAYVLHPPASA
jgi:hypothetical protein